MLHKVEKWKSDHNSSTLVHSFVSFVYYSRHGGKGKWGGNPQGWWKCRKELDLSKFIKFTWRGEAWRVRSFRLFCFSLSSTVFLALVSVKNKVGSAALTSCRHWSTLRGPQNRQSQRSSTQKISLPLVIRSDSYLEGETVLTGAQLTHIPLLRQEITWSRYHRYDTNSTVLSKKKKGVLDDWDEHW